MEDSNEQFDVSNSFFNTTLDSGRDSFDYQQNVEAGSRNLVESFSSSLEENENAYVLPDDPSIHEQTALDEHVEDSDKIITLEERGVLQILETHAEGQLWTTLTNYVQLLRNQDDFSDQLKVLIADSGISR